MLQPAPDRARRASAWKGSAVADEPATQDGELALGKNILAGFVPSDGCNYKDKIVISERVVREDMFTSIHIEKLQIEPGRRSWGPRRYSRHSQRRGRDLGDLDKEGIIRVGAEVKAGDILVGKITPKGETELTAEERLLRAIFGEKARDVKDTSLRVPHGERGKVVDVQIFTREATTSSRPA